MQRSRVIVRIASLIFTGVALVWLTYIGTSRSAPSESVYIPPPTRVTPAALVLQEYVRIDTSNPPGNEIAGARFLARQFERAGIPAEVIESAPGRGNVYARIRGKRRGEGLLLLHHIDVVRAKRGQWKREPFGGQISQDRLYGRGSLDMKGIGIAHLLAFQAVAQRGEAPERDLIFLATADEERGGTLGLVWLLEHRPDIFEGVTGAISEGGITEMRADKVQYFGVEVGSKQFIRARLSSPSRGELEKVRIALEPFFHPRDPDRLLPAVQEYFEQISEHRLTNREIFQDPAGAIARGEFWKLHANYRALAQNTVSATAIRPDRANFAMDVTLQLLPDENAEAFLRQFRERVAPVSLVVTRTSGKTNLSPTSTELFALIRRAVQKSLGPIDVGPYVFAYGATDCRYLRARGIVAYGFFPFPVDYFQTETIHGADEFIRLERFHQGVDLLKDLTASYCFEK